MRRFSLAVCGVATLLAGPASAQVMPVGTCTGTVAADIGFAARKTGETNLTSIAATNAPNVFSRAECDCAPTDDSGTGIYMRIQPSMTLPAGTATTVSAWVGSGCDDYATRINTSAVSCRQYTPLGLDSSGFNAGSGHTVTNPYDLFVPARQLFSPQTGTCDTDASNSLWIFIGLNPQKPDATCKVAVSERANGPSRAFEPAAASGDSAVNLTWTAPTTNNTPNLRAAEYYQILCATPSGAPLPDSLADPGYSTCLADGSIRRRQNIFGASNINTNPTDGGTSDLSVSSSGIGSSSSALAGGGEPAWPRAIDDMGTDDLGTTNDLSVTNALDNTPRPTSFPELGVFSALDPKFVCSGLIPATGLTFNRRIDNLENGTAYQFVIVAIDVFGNPTPTAIIDGTPQPVDDLYSRLRNSGSTAQGFCFVATAAYGDYDHPQVRVLRAFRDRILAPTAAGRALIRAYYAASPPLARFIEQSATRRFFARGVLWPLVAFAALALQLGSLVLALGVAGGVPAALMWLRRRRLRRRAHVEAHA